MTENTLTHKAIDLGVRALISILFRVLIVFYSVALLSTSSNCYQWYIYLIVTIIYPLVYFILFVRFTRFKYEKLWSFLRTINDFIYIFIILYKKDLAYLPNIILLILPMANSFNHASKSVSRTFSVQIYLITLLTLFFLRGKHLFWWDAAALGAIAIMNLFLSFRSSIIEFNNSLYDTIESFYTDRRLVLGKSHELLRKVVKALNSGTKSVGRFGRTEKIVCFSIIKSQFKIFASTDFILSFSIEDEQSLLRDLQQNKSVTDHKVTLNDNISLTNGWIYVQSENAEYVYYIGFQNNHAFLFSSLYYKKVFVPLFHKITKVILVEGELRNERKKYLDKLKNRLEFVDSTVKAIHFLNNRLSPVTNYFALLKKIESMNPDDPLKLPLQEILLKEQKIAKDNVPPIIEKANKILRTSSNPYIITDSQRFELYHLVTIIRRNWDERGVKSDLLIVNWSPELLGKKLSLNEDAFEYVVDELITNMLKHHKSSYNIRFDIDDNKPVIYFVNDLSHEHQIGYLIRLQQNINSVDLSSLMKRNHHGLSLIKLFLSQLNMSFNLTVENHIYKFRIILNHE